MSGIYISSKVKHASRWRNFKEIGLPIISSWIDITPPNIIWNELWHQCIIDIKNADVLICYMEDGETYSGVLAEIGMALYSNTTIMIVCSDVMYEKHSILKHELVKRFSTIYEAFREAQYCRNVEKWDEKISYLLTNDL
jgi:hypothetical protein